MKVVVTGAGGYLGSALCSSLATDHDVVGIHRGTRSALVLGGARLVEADIVDERTLTRLFGGADVIFHLAAVTGEQKCLADPISASRSNLLGTVAVARAAKAARVGRLIFASSYWVYTVFGPHRMPLAEDDELGTDTLYGAMKAVGEEIVSSIPRSVSVRFSNVYGFGAGRGALWDGFVGRSVTAALAGRPITVYGTGEQGVELIHISDALHALRLVSERTLRHAVYNIGSGMVTSVSAIARAIAEVVGEKTGRSVEVRHEDAPVGKVWPDRWLDISLARSDLSFEPRTSLRDGLGELVEASLVRA